MVFMNDFLYFLASYVGVIVLGLVILNWLSNGILIKFIRIKASRGSKIFTKIHSKLKTYVVAGWIEGDSFLYFDNESKANKQKTPKRIIIQDKKMFYRFMGVWACDINEAKNTFIDHESGQAVSGFDPITWNNLFIRALMKPASEEKKQIIFFIILIICILALLLGIVSLVKINSVSNAVNGLNAIKQAAVTGANII